MLKAGEQTRSNGHLTWFTDEKAVIRRDDPLARSHDQPVQSVTALSS